MYITCIADLHGYKPELPKGDVLVIAGDCTATHGLKEWAAFFVWLKEQPYKHKILVAGNHDYYLYTTFPKTKKEASELADIRNSLNLKLDFHYLCDSGITIEGIKFWGSPWTLRFEGQNPEAAYFTKNTEAQLKSHYNKIPYNTDILITHNPPLQILDKTIFNGHVGSHNLRKIALDSSIKYHVFGHIHEGSGEYNLDTKVFLNCSYVDERYKPRHNFWRIHYDTNITIGNTAKSSH